jgi:hypothetical protein
MEERRQSPRRTVLKTGLVVLQDTSMTLRCTVRNLSDTGACIELSSTTGVPNNFEFVLDDVHRPCRVIWRTDTRMGIAFN